MDIIQNLLYTVSNHPGGYRLIYNILYDGKDPAKKLNDQTIRNTLS